jgi:hypothetical protein
VFAELGDKFAVFTDVINEVSERTSCASNMDLLRLYEKWLRTGSPRSGQLLIEQGVVPNASLKTLRIQEASGSGLRVAYRKCDRSVHELTTLREFFGPLSSPIADMYRCNGENRSLPSGV